MFEMGRRNSYAGPAGGNGFEIVSWEYPQSADEPIGMAMVVLGGGVKWRNDKS